MKEDYFGPEPDPQGSLLHEVEPQRSDLPAADEKPRKRQIMGYDLSSVLLAGGVIILLAVYAVWPDSQPAPSFIPDETPSQESALTFTAVTPFTETPEAETLRAYSTTNREAITLLNDRTGDVEQRLAGMEGQLKTLATPPTPQAQPPEKSPALHDTSTLQGWKIYALHPGVAWLAFNGSTWAAKKGDVLKGITILSIDTEQRVVITDKGVIRQGG